MNQFSQLDLHPNILKAIPYPQPTPVQAQSMPGILKGKDCVISAPTGSGKTAAFVLPALQRITAQRTSKRPRILILTPTRELANQITAAASIAGKFLQFNIVSLVGGMSYHHQIKDLARGADIVVATPGRLIDHIEQKRVDLSAIEMLVLDEADRMLDMGFIDDVNYIAKLTPAHRQTLLFSATIDNQLATVIRHLLKDPVRIDLSKEKISIPQIKQSLYKVSSPQHKSRLLKHFLNDENIYKAIIFSATKINADKLANQLRNDGFSAAALHGDLKQNVRNRTIEQLRRGKVQFLVATDVAARGIDISDISHVINYDMPRFCEDYVHRIGRTGRAGKSGIAISFVLPTDGRHLQRIERYIGQRLTLMHPVELAPESTSTAPKVLTLDKAFNKSDSASLRPAFKSRRSERSSERNNERNNERRGERSSERTEDSNSYFKKRRAKNSNSPFKKSASASDEKSSSRSFKKSRWTDESSDRKPSKSSGKPAKQKRFSKDRRSFNDGAK